MSHARPPIHVALVFAAAFSAGCQSGVERDVVQREMRQQEDQIYALEDYLSEYQQLLCDARTENAMLKRKIVQGQYRGDRANGRGDQSESLPSPPTTRRSDTRAPAAEPSVIPPEVPPLDLSEPAVPPLEDQSANELAELDHEVQPAAAAIEVVGEPATAVVLRGKVRLDEGASGPRLLVEVQPVDDQGQLAEFHGSMSLLVLDPAARAKEQQLARWDIQPDDLQALAAHLEHGTWFEFPLQLPADAPTNRPLELWVRLVPEDGEKLLGRTTMDLSRAGRFASADVKPAENNRHSVHVAAAEVPIEPGRRQAIRKLDTDVQQSGWQTARPGEIAKPQAAAANAAREWKLATRPVPEVESTPVADDDRYGVATAPDWSPERPDDGQAESPPEPAWSPTRVKSGSRIARPGNPSWSSSSQSTSGGAVRAATDRLTKRKTKTTAPRPATRQSSRTCRS